jgi:hypothetical protein
MNACRTTLTKSVLRNRIWGLGNTVRSIVVPPYGGETLIANAGSAYRDLAAGNCQA